MRIQIYHIEFLRITHTIYKEKEVIELNIKKKPITERVLRVSECL